MSFVLRKEVAVCQSVSSPGQREGGKENSTRRRRRAKDRERKEEEEERGVFSHIDPLALASELVPLLIFALQHDLWARG